MSDDYTADELAAYDRLDELRDKYAEPVRRRAGERRATVFMWGLAFDCTFEYIPEETRTYEHPGSPEQVNLTAAFSGETDMLDMLELLTETDNVDVIEQKLLEAME